jgi:hypothetical protein
MPLMLSNATATGPVVKWQGGNGTFVAAGNFGGATVTLQYRGPDGVTWTPMGPNTTLSAAGGGVFACHEVDIRAEVAGGTPSGLFAQVERVSL